MSAKVTYPTKSLLQGGPYTPAAATDLRAKFAAIKAAAIKARNEKLKPVPRVAELKGASS